MTVESNYLKNLIEIADNKLDLYFQSTNLKGHDSANSNVEGSSASVQKNDLMQPSNNERTCSNCGTSSTSTWRNLGDRLVCNACKCFYRKHGKNRPIHMRKDMIVSRHRKSCKSTVPHEGMFQINDDLTDVSELDSSVVAEAVCMMLQYLKNL